MNLLKMSKQRRLKFECTYCKFLNDAEYDILQKRFVIVKDINTLIENIFENVYIKEEQQLCKNCSKMFKVNLDNLYIER